MSEVDAVELLPGDPDTVDQLAAALHRASGLLRGAVDRITTLGAAGSVWEGPVAQAFIDHVSDLGRRVGVLESELSTAASQLTTWREGLLDRRQQLAALRQELAATETGDAADDAAMADRDRLQAQLRALADEHDAAGTVLAQALRRVAEATTDPAGGLDGTAWLLHAETLLHQLDQQIGGWVTAQGPALTEAVNGVSQSTAVTATVGHAAGSLGPGLDVALGAAVASVAAAAPASHRLVASARRAQTAIPLDLLPPATFAAAARRK